MNVEIEGSFLLPDTLKEANRRFAANEITADELKAVQDSEIRRLLDRQKAAGLKRVSDGEFRRLYWDKSFFWHIGGLEHSRLEEGRVDQPVSTFTDHVRLVKTISFNPAHPVFDEFEFLRDEAAKRGLTPRIAIPAPAQLYYELMKNRDTVLRVYEGSIDRLIEDIAAVYRATIKQLYEIGCRELALDDAVWHRLCDPARAKRLLQDGRDIIEVTANDLRVNQLSLEGRPAGMRVTEQLCLSDHDSDAEMRTSFNAVADKVLACLDVDAFHIPMSLSEPEDYEALAMIPKGKEVVLGVVSTIYPQLESESDIMWAIDQASAYVDRSCLSLAPRCGFNWPKSPTIAFQPRDQWSKLALLQQVASQA